MRCVDAFSEAAVELQNELESISRDRLNRSSPSHLRRLLVNKMEHLFVSTVLGVAHSVLGRKRVPLLSPSSPPTPPSAEYLDTKRRLGMNYVLLRQYGHLSADDPLVSTLLETNMILKTRLTVLDGNDHTNSYREWTSDLCNLSAPQRMKVLNRSMRRRSAAGSSLATTPTALDSYRNHFGQQFINSFPVPEYNPPVINATDNDHAEFYLCSRTS